MLTFESIERLRLFVQSHRQVSLRAAYNARINGYNTVAADHANQAHLAELILQDLSKEYGVSNARQDPDNKEW